MKYTYLLAPALFAATMGWAQQSAQEQKATSAYEDFAWATAIKHYQAADALSLTSKRNLAASYEHTGEVNKALDTYKEIANSKDATSEDLVRYSQALRKQGKYNEANQAMAKFKSQNQSDRRAKSYSDQIANFEAFRRDKGKFKIKNLAANSAHEEFGVTYYKDAVVFASTRKKSKAIKRVYNSNKLPFLELYSATKGSDAEFTNIALFSKSLSGKFHEGPATFSADGNTIIYTSNNYTGKSKNGAVKLQLFQANFNDGKWSSPAALPFNNPEYSVGHASLSPDGQLLYFASDMPGGIGGVDLYVSKKQANGSWGPAMNAGSAINTEGDEMFPFVHPDGLLFFASDGHLGLGGLDVFVARIAGENSYQAPENVGAPLNSSQDDFSFVLDKNQRQGYFASNREGGQGDDDIYSFEMLEKVVVRKSVSGTLQDKKGRLLAGVELQLFDAAGNLVGTTTTDEQGKYSLQALANATYELTSAPANDFEFSRTVSTKNDGNTVVENIKLPNYAKPMESLAGTTIPKDLPVTKVGIETYILKVKEIDPIYYGLGASTINAKAKVELDRVVEIMNLYPDLKIELGAHTDCRGSASINQTLSTKRAKAAMKYIQAKISNPERLTAKGYGESQLVNDCGCEGPTQSDCDEADHQLNRRTEYKVMQ